MDWFLYDWDFCHERINLFLYVAVINPILFSVSFLYPVKTFSEVIEMEHATKMG